MAPPERLGSAGWTYIDAFVGREVELARLLDLAQGGERLVTVLGPGGIGKTRLVQELVRRLGVSGALAAVFCDLTGVRDEDGVLRLVALALEASSPGVGSSLEAIAAALRLRGDVLLVVDNCEQVIEAVAPIALRLLDLAPRARLLATSRQILNVRCERVVELGPLGLPARPEDAEASDAFSLLLDRTRRARFDFEVVDSERAILFDIVRALEGLPLAIELAAPRIARLGSATVLARLSRRLDLLTGGVGDRPGHHRTLRDAVDWSWELLNPDERSFLAQCSVFRSGFTLAAAEAVVERTQMSRAPEAIDLLQALEEKSLVQARRGPALPGERRFGLLETVREFAEEKLAEPDTRAAELRHARYYAKELEALALDPAAPSSAERIDLEKENLRAVVERMTAKRAGESIDARDERALLALAVLGAIDPSLLPFTWARLGEHIDGALAMLSPGDSPTRARALYASGHVRWRIGPLSRARADFADAAAVASRVGERRLEGRATAGACMVGAQQRSDVDSIRALEVALAIHREVGDRRFEASTLLRLGLQRGELGEAARAREHFEEALALAKLVSDARLEAQILAAMGVLLAEGEDYVGALARLEDALARSQGPQPTIECALGMVRHAAGALSEALESFRRGMLGSIDRGDRYSDALCRGFAALVTLELGDVDRARAELDDACARFEELGYARYAAFFVAHLATIEARTLGARASMRIALARKKLELEADPFHIALDLQAACIAAREGDAAIATEWSAARGAILSKATSHLIVELRLSLRIADLEIRALAGARAEPPFIGLRVHVGGHWFEQSGAVRVECRERAVLRRLLARLAAGRRDAPGEILPAEALIEAAWPGEKMSLSAAKNRLKVHIAKLREIGLRGALLSSEGGYFFDPELPFQIVR